MTQAPVIIQVAIASGASACRKTQSQLLQSCKIHNLYCSDVSLHTLPSAFETSHRKAATRSCSGVGAVQASASRQMPAGASTLL